MAQRGEARAEPANARVGTIQKWLIGLTAGCWVAGIALAFGIEFPPDNSLLASNGIISGIFYLLIGAGWLAYFAGQGLLLYLWPRDVEGRLRFAAQRTGVPRLYGLVLIWSGICMALAWLLFNIYLNHLPDQDYSKVLVAVVGLFVASMLPLLLLEAYGWWRRHIHRMAE